ncbi:MAG: precorrin-6Y C5,15-methyltransferase (decarboxylating) subunit CbiT, partial [Spirochaetota bacterium]
ILDIGAGTGSVSVECARAAARGTVYACERNAEALNLIRRNAGKFAADNIVIIEGEAPGSLEKAGSFDRAFIGGSGGNLAEILDYVYSHIGDNGRIVVTAVTIDTLAEARNFFRSRGCAHEIIQIAVTRVEETGGVSMLKALTPVFIISADRSRS